MSSELERRSQEAQQPEKVDSIAGWLDRFAPQLEKALPKGLSAERITRAALTCVRKNKKLAECTPASFAAALLTSAALGLDFTAGEAYLVPYKKECTLIIGYQGMSKLFYQHPLAEVLQAHTVYEGDEFEYELGTNPYIVHRPGAVESRGQITHYYATARLKNGAYNFAILTPEEVRDLRSGMVGTKGDIPDPQHWMEKKTAIRQLFKYLPKSVSLQTAIEVDEKTGTEIRGLRLDLDELTAQNMDEVEGEVVNDSELD